MSPVRLTMLGRKDRYDEFDEMSEEAGAGDVHVMIVPFAPTQCFETEKRLFLFRLCRWRARGSGCQHRISSPTRPS